MRLLQINLEMLLVWPGRTSIHGSSQTTHRVKRIPQLIFEKEDDNDMNPLDHNIWHNSTVIK